MAKQRLRLHMWVGVSVLLGTAIYAIAEDLTLVTYYPSPRGVYNELRTRGNVQIGSITAPADPSTAPRLHVVGGADTTQLQITANATQSNTNPLLRALASGGTTELFRLHSDSMFNLFLGEWAGRLNDTSGPLGSGVYNTFIGSRTGFSNTRGSYNTATGSQALNRNTTGNASTATGKSALESNTTGGGNTATGANALRANTTGAANTATGNYALVTNTIGVSNTAMGVFAMELNTSGDANTAIGVYALRANTTADDNTAIGSNAMYSNTTGTANVATGTVALRANTTGSRNTATGFAALAQNITGANNTATGNAALWSNTTGANNTALGYEAGGNITTGSNNIVIGYDIDAPSATGSNQLTIGNLIFGTGLDGTGTTLSTGNVGIGTTAPAAALDVAGTLKVVNHYFDANDDGWLRVRDAENGNYTDVAVGQFWSDSNAYFAAGDGIWTSSGNVGIGTTAPGSRLHVRGAGSGLGVGTWALNVTDGVGVSRLLVKDNGQVGIGTTIPDPSFLLHVGSGIGAVRGARIDDRLYVDGPITAAGPKAFRIAHPLRPADSDLIHAAIEGPEAGVYYRGEAALVDGTAMVALPTYFEALTRPEGRTVLVTPKGLIPFAVSATEVQDGRFSVYGTKADGAFSWEVKAVRADVPPLEVEVAKDAETVDLDAAP